MGFQDLFRPKWKNSDGRLRRDAIAKLTDQTILSEIAKTETDGKVRKVAVAKIADQAILAGIAKMDEDDDVRTTAVGMIIDQTILTDIAKTAKPGNVRRIATGKIDDQAILTEIAKTDQIGYVRQAAVEKIDDQTFLNGVARTDKDSDVRKAAIKKVTDQAVLAEIATTEEIYYLREAALVKIFDQTVLAEIAKEDKDWEVRLAALKKINDRVVLNGIAESDKDDRVRAAAIGILTNVGKVGDRSSELRQFRTKIKDLRNSYVLSGDWLQEVFPGKQNYEIMKQIDDKAFQDQGDDKFKWTMAYLHHPDPGVLARVLAAAAPIKQLGLLENYAYLVTHGDVLIEKVAIDHFWTSVDASGFEIFLNVLGSSGFMPSGVDQGRAKWAVIRILAKCPEDYPAAQRTAFGEKAKERFGPGVVSVMSSESRGEGKPQAIYKKTAYSKSPLGQTSTYEIYTADSKDKALAFLETKTVTEGFFYIVVETPQGNWGKDKTGFYQEK